MCDPVSGAVITIGMLGLYNDWKNNQRNREYQKSLLYEQMWYNRQNLKLQREGLKLDAAQLGISQGQLELQGEQIGLQKEQLGLQFQELFLSGQDLDIQREQVYEQKLALEKENLLSKREAYYAASVDDFNAAQMENEAVQVGIQGVREIQATKSDGKQFIGAQRSNVSGSGIVVDSGTSGDLIRESEANIRYDTRTIRQNYLRKQKTIRAEAQQLIEEGAFNRAQGDFLSEYNTQEEIQNAIAKPGKTAFSFVDPVKFGSLLNQSTPIVSYKKI